jgi:cytochrome c oxidase assembly protein subunit 15
MSTRFTESRWPFRLALLLATVTFPLIWVGGLVTTYDAGMAVPDWPGTYGYNLFLDPWQTWIAGPWDLFIEHGHRLLGALSGMLTIGFVLAVFRWDRRVWLRYFSLGALAAVILQGCLGGARVLLDDRQLAMLHGCFGPAFFAYCTALVAFLSPLWEDPLRARQHPRAKSLHRFTLLTATLVYVQLVFGAQMRHIPVTAPPWLFNISLILHLANALLLVGAVWAISASLGRERSEPALRRPAWWLAGLFCLQLVLGCSTWIVKYGWPWWFSGLGFAAGYAIQAKSMLQTGTATLHMAVGSLILATSVLISVRCWRLLKVAAGPERSLARNH